MKLNGSLLNVKGRSDLFFRAEINKKITAFLILAATIPFGITVMCIGLILYAFADIRIITIYVRKVLNVKLMPQLKDISGILLLSLSMGAVTYFFSILTVNPYLKILFGMVAAVIYFFMISWLFHFREFGFIVSLIRGRMKP